MVWHMLRREEDHVTRRVMNMVVEGRRRPGRARRRWMDCVKEDLVENRLRKEDANDRKRWKALTRNDDPT